MLQTAFATGLTLVSSVNISTCQGMKRDEFATPDASDDVPASAIRTDGISRRAWSRHLEGTLTILRFGSANLLLALGCIALYLGGLTPWLVVVPALIFASFADDALGDDADALTSDKCLFCTINLYLGVPLVALLAVLLARFSGAHSGFSDRPFELIGAIWLVSYLFALVGATVAHEFTHKAGRLSRLAANILLGFTFNGSSSSTISTRTTGRSAPITTPRPRGAASASAPSWRGPSLSNSCKLPISRRRG